MVRKVIRIEQGLVRPETPRTATLRPKRLSQYPHLSRGHQAAARRLSSPLLMGPPICDELIALVEHTFREDEAEVVGALSGVHSRNAAQVAARTGRPRDEAREILDGLADGKRAIASVGSGSQRRFRLLPIMPGIFEMVLISEAPDTMSAWHRRFAELVEALFETGYTLDYQRQPSPLFRFLPIHQLAATHPAALPADQLEAILDRYELFGVANCQCRMSASPDAAGCGRPLEVCTAMGEFAERGIASGWLRSVSRRALLDIKREAEAHGLVTWFLNVESPRGQISCSCCGCCCKAMRMVNEFNAPGMIAPPHFMPHFDRDTCTFCGRCASSCPMGAITVDTRNKDLQHEPHRCVGCGLCQVACPRSDCIQMRAVPEYRMPYRSWFSMLLRNTPSILKTSWKVWRSR